MYVTFIVGGNKMSRVLVEVTRGPIVECIHRGDVAVVNNRGDLLYSAGDPYKVTYFRSSAKPIQAFEVILSRAAEHFKLTDKEIAIMCASHYGEDYHIKTVEGILKKIGLTKDNLLCGITSSLNPDYAIELARKNTVLNQLYNNCSGKHSGMLSVCVQKGYDVDSYNKVDHPVQIAMKGIVAKMCGIDEKDIVIGTDGCTVPVFGMPVYNMALGYAKLANPDVLDDSYKKAAERIFKSMNEYPEMIAGTNGFCSELMRKTHGKLIAKLGADGVYCIGVKDKNIGIAIKIEDGASRALSPAAMQALEDLDVLTKEEIESLKDFKVKPNKNNIGNAVGEIRPAYHLEKK